MSYDIQTIIATLSGPAAGVVKAKAELVLAEARALVIDGQAMYEIAAEELGTVKGKWKELDADRKAMKAPFAEYVKQVDSFFNPALQFLAEAEGIIKTAMLTYQTQQEAIAAAQRKQLEQQVAQERQRLEAEAGILFAQGTSEAVAQAESMQAVAAVITAPAVDVVEAKADGVSTATSLDYEVTDMLALVRHVAKHPELIHLLTFDAVKMRAFVRSGAAGNLPGVKVVEKKTIRARSKA